MMPEDELSTTPAPAPFVFPRNIPRRPFIEYEYGGVAIQDGSRGIRDRVWKGEYIEGQIVLSAEGVPPTPVLTVAGVTEFQFTFDRNMQPFVCYRLESGTARFYWFDTLIEDFTTTTLPAGSVTPCCAHDDNRDLENDRSDIILAYVRAGGLYYRQQRDRYETERLLATQVNDTGLIQIGMNQGLRFQFQLWGG